MWDSLRHHDSRHETTAVEAAATATGRCGGSTVAFEAELCADWTLSVWVFFLTPLKVTSYIERYWNTWSWMCLTTWVLKCSWFAVFCSGSANLAVDVLRFQPFSLHIPPLHWTPFLVFFLGVRLSFFQSSPWKTESSNTKSDAKPWSYQTSEFLAWTPMAKRPGRRLNDPTSCGLNQIQWFLLRLDKVQIEEHQLIKKINKQTHTHTTQSLKLIKGSLGWETSDKRTTSQSLAIVEWVIVESSNRIV